MISYDLSGKTALVTGAASGIGLATVELLAQSGAQVAINDLPANPQLPLQIERLTKKGYKVFAAPGDAGNSDNAQAMVSEAIRSLGGQLDYLVNNAGTPGTSSVIAPTDFESQNEAMWQQLLNVNLIGPARCTAAAESALRASRGAIVNTASIAGIRGNGSSAIYSATKAGLISLTSEYARGLGPDVRVNAIAPGIVESNWDCKFELPEEFVNTLPLQRIGKPQDYAEVIIFLLAAASYITGECIVVDGGLITGRRA